jgi:excinuclease UvrABC nuclease subunit
MRLDELLPVKIELPAPPTPIDPKTFPAHGAVYLLADEADRPVQLASTEQLRRAMLNRLADRSDTDPSRRADLRAVTHAVRFVPTFSQFETTFEFHRVSRALYPESYRDLVGFGPAWFAQMTPADPLPRFTLTNRNLFKDAVTVGPFRSRAQGKQFIELIEDIFDLCRYHDVLDQTPNGEACAYYEMGKCPAPCNGSVPVETYRHAVRHAGRFAAGSRQDIMTEWRTDMDRAAKALAFETAANLKQKIDRGEKLDAKAFQAVRSFEDFNFLIIQRAGGRSKLKPFFVHRGRITRGQTVTTKNLPQIIPQWRRQATTPAEATTEDPIYRDEQVWLVSHFLFKADRVGGLYLRVDDLPSDAEFVPMLTEKFNLTPPKTPEMKGEVKALDPRPADPTMVNHETKGPDAHSGNPA